jgi:membrane fusion protein (multidrug efflux system)
MNRKQASTGIIFIVVVASALLLPRQTCIADADDTANTDEKVASVVTVQTGKLQRVTLNGYVDGYGSVGPAPAMDGQSAASADVASPVAGVVAEVKVWEGETVNKGDLLVQLGSHATDVAVDYAEKAVNRQRKLFQENNTSQKAVEDAEQQLAAAKAQQELLSIRAPLSGTITKLNVRPGEAVDLTTVVASITDLNHLIVSTDIPAAEAGAVKPGQKVELQATPPVESSVTYVRRGILDANGTMRVGMEIPTGSVLNSGQWLSLRIVTVTHTNVLAAPEGSVVKNDEGKDVIAVVTNDTATQVPVEIGLRDNGLVEVSAPGLQEGATVVTTGAYGLPAQTKIRLQNP